MANADKYLRELDRISHGTGGTGSERFRKAYSEAKESVGKWGDNPDLNKAYLKMDDEEVREKSVEIRARARELMQSAIGKGEKSFGPHYNLTAALNGALLYEKIGKGRKAIPKLLKAAKLANDEALKRNYSKVQDFIERNTSDEPSGGLEGKMAVFAVSVIGGIVLSISSLSATGNVISNISGTTQGLAGVFLFIFGILGLAFSLRR